MEELQLHFMGGFRGRAYQEKPQTVFLQILSLQGLGLSLGEHLLSITALCASTATESTILCFLHLAYAEYVKDAVYCLTSEEETIWVKT